MGVELEVRRRIHERGRITFAEYMELALFWPDGGYYTDPSNIGAEGDFYTAPGAHPAFGALLCIQAYQMWDLLDRSDPFWLVEMGAGAGLLCHDLLAYSAHLPQDFHHALRYVCMDRVAQRGAEEQLSDGARRRVDRLAAQDIALRGITGCVLSNELVDSFPVHRVSISNGELREIYVTLEGEKLVESLDSPSTPALAERLDSLGVRLTEGFSTEINLVAGSWLEEVSDALDRGFVLTIDYGHTATDLYSERRRRGTLSCFYSDIQTDDLPLFGKHRQTRI